MRIDPGPSGFRTNTATSAMSRSWKALKPRVWRRSRWVANEHFAPAALVVIADAGRPRIGDGLRRGSAAELEQEHEWSQRPRFWLARRVEAAAMPRCWR